MTSFGREPRVAVMFIGNKGSGKSTLLKQVGGTNFESGITDFEGLTTEVQEQTVILDSQVVTLIDTPGLYDVDDATTGGNAKKLSEALSRGYHYKLFFVVMAHSRTLSNEDLALLSRVNEAVHQSDMGKVEFHIIVNQIQSPREYSRYERHARDNFESYFQKLSKKKIEGFSFDINVEGALLLPYDEVAVEHNGFRDQLAEQVMAQSSVPLHIDEIQTTTKDAETVSIASAFAAGFMTCGAAAAAVFFAARGNGDAARQWIADLAAKPETREVVKVTVKLTTEVAKAGAKAVAAAKAGGRL
ncbi:hypothetical protein BGX28_007320 [Mortierella sp. GBA30]|nr:hypothetical protein BGX28_007320 [Mortierella sp. GBA30]